jgi:hypothetical protein
MRRRNPARQEPRDSNLFLPKVLFLFLALLLLPVTPALLLRAAADAVCGSYNFISNDFCGEWRFVPPPADEFPVPEGWAVAWEYLSCGSGGCPDRVFVLRPTDDLVDPVAGYAARLRGLGWDVRRGESQEHRYFIGRLEDFILRIEPAASEFAVAPDRFQDGDHVEIAFALIDEAAATYE